MVKAAEHRPGYDLDWALLRPLRCLPRHSGAEFRYALAPLMRSAFVVVGDVSHHGAAKMIFRQVDEVVQTLPPQASHEPLDVGRRVGGAVGDRDPL